MKEFKVGDKVYFPMRTTKVCTVTKSSSVVFPLLISTMGVALDNCTASGKILAMSTVPNIFHATQENKELLEKLHGVEFEAAPPETRTVTFERPETFIPTYGEHYWFIVASVNGGVRMGTNDGSTIDDFRITNGVWRTKEEALMVAKAIFNIEKDS